MMVLEGLVHGSACSGPPKLMLSISMVFCILLLVIFIFILIYAWECYHHGYNINTVEVTADP